MSYLVIYLILAAWFSLIDMIAGAIADSPHRPIASILLNLFWPLSLAFALLASAAIIKRLRDGPPVAGGAGK